MDFLIYIYVFIIGIVCGSFFSLAIYRIPKGQDIINTRSYCPNCKHKLSFWDMIPLFSYIGLKGKCRYCKRKISPTYFLLELFSGIVFVLFAVSIRLEIYNINASVISYLIFGLLYIAGLFIISGIDKEKKQIQPQLLIYLLIIETLYIIYLYVVEKTNIYRYAIYLIILILLNIFNMIYYKKKVKNNYTLELLILLIEMAIFTYEICTVYTIILAFLTILIKLLINKILQKRKKYVKKDKTEKAKIPFGFYLGVSNIIVLILTNMLIFYRWLNEQIL